MAESCHFFPAENAGNITEITAFAVFHLTFFLIFVVLYLSDSHHQVGPFSTLLVWDFLKISSLFFLIFCSKMRIRNAQNMAEFFSR